MYLLDTSLVSVAGKPDDARYAQARAFLGSAEHLRQKLYISVVTIAETQFGLHLLKYRTQPVVKAEDIAAVEAKVNGIAAAWESLPVTNHIALAQGELRAAYAKIRMPHKVATGADFKGIHVELWHESVPPSALHITENDIWIAATAITHDLVLVAADEDFKELKKAASELKLHVLD